MQAASCVAPGNRLRGSGAKRDAATVNLLAPRVGDLGIRASLEAFEQSDNKRRPLLGGESECLVQDVVNAGVHAQNSSTGQRQRAPTSIWPDKSSIFPTDRPKMHPINRPRMQAVPAADLRPSSGRPYSGPLLTMDFGFTPIAQDAISQALRLRWLSAESAGVASAWDSDPPRGTASPGAALEFRLGMTATSRHGRRIRWTLPPSISAGTTIMR